MTEVEKEPSASPSRKRTRKMLLLVLPMALVLAIGWQWYGKHFPSWDEEVLLSDGRMISVHRAHKFNTEHALIETALTFDLPEMGGKQTWREFLYPAIVDVHQGKVYVVGSVTYNSAWQYQNPKYGYVAFVFLAPIWQRIPLTSLPESIRKNENIAFCETSALLLSWTSKQTGWCTLEGQFSPGASREINLAARENNAKKMAELSGTSVKSE